MSAISISINYTRSASCSEKALSGLSSVFYLGGPKDTIFNANEVRQESCEISWKTIALKVACYVLFLPLTIPLFGIYLALRYHFCSAIKDSSANTKVEQTANAILPQTPPIRKADLESAHPTVNEPVKTSENSASNATILSSIQVEQENSEQCEQIDKLGPQESFIPEALMEKAKKNNVYLFKFSQDEVNYLIFSKDLNLKSSCFSPAFKKILKSNSLITQRIPWCFYTSAFLHFKVDGMQVISMGDHPHKEESCLIKHSMMHHQTLFQNPQEKEYIILDPTWPRFEDYQSVALLASSETDLRELYKIAFGRSYDVKPPFTSYEDASRVVCTSINLKP